MTEQVFQLSGNNLKIIQHQDYYRFGLEAVLLADFVEGMAEDKVCDFGSGDGVIPLLLAYKKKMNVLGLELQQQLVDMANRSIVLNNLQDKVKIIKADILNAKNFLTAESFDIITANPPFFPKGAGLINSRENIAICKHEINCSLQDIFELARYLVKYRGCFFLVQRPQRISDIFDLALRYQLEPQTLLFVHPRQGKEANIVLVKMRKGGKRGNCKIKPPLYVYDKHNVYTKELEEIYHT